MKLGKAGKGEVGTIIVADAAAKIVRSFQAVDIVFNREPEAYAWSCFAEYSTLWRA